MVAAAGAGRGPSWGTGPDAGPARARGGAARDDDREPPARVGKRRELRVAQLDHRAPPVEPEPATADRNVPRAGNAGAETQSGDERTHGSHGKRLPRCNPNARPQTS